MQTPQLPTILTPFERLSNFMEDMLPTSTLFRGAWNPVVDIKENEKEYVILAELPGMNREDLDVHVTGDVLVIQGKREEAKEDKREGFIRKERNFGTFYRSFRLESMVKPDHILAEYKDGVLKLVVPKAVQAEPKRITVK